MTRHACEDSFLPTVLVVDDNPEVVELLVRYLSLQGMKILPAYSGQQCLERAVQEPVDVVVLDVMMPGMDGLQVCEALKAMPETRATPIILLTAKDDKETRLRGIRLGVSEFLTKPVRGKELVTRIQTQITMRYWLGKLERELEELAESYDTLGEGTQI